MTTTAGPHGHRLLFAAAATALLAAAPLEAQHRSVAKTVHNLSASGPGEVKAVGESQVCKFCHVPHSAVVPAPLWGHKLSVAVYKTGTLGRGGPDAKVAPQPNGSSRLCLSCHDGTVALGDVAGERRPIAFREKQMLAPGRKGFLGTDLSGSHPVSFALEDKPSSATGGPDSDMGVRPLAAMKGDRDVRPDEAGRMQCTTCHDPHSDQNYVAGKVPHFWVKSSVEEVCLTCHVSR